MNYKAEQKVAEYRSDDESCLLPIHLLVCNDYLQYRDENLTHATTLSAQRRMC